MAHQKDNFTELLAPAGDINAAYAAFQYGADAIYLGLKNFSARATALNFTLDELNTITKYAHSINKKIFVTLNTIVHQQDISNVIQILSDLSDINVDAVIIQDLGILNLIQRYFPHLCVHASTQLAIHNIAGVKAAKELGFSRVVLARELTLDEIKEISRLDIETEVFIHGALCYSYSGLCLYSSLLRGKSGNCGECIQPCRDIFKFNGDELNHNYDSALLFSMKDLNAGRLAKELEKIGVTSLKIEGRKKDALYVVAITDLYRNILDDGKIESNKQNLIKSIFSREDTSLYLDNTNNKSVIDNSSSSHKGIPLGKVDAFQKKKDDAYVVFKTNFPIEKHDGIQIEIQNEHNLFGFAVDQIFFVNGNNWKQTFTANQGDTIAVKLPLRRPTIEEGFNLYCSSSAYTKKQYQIAKTPTLINKQLYPLYVNVRLDADKISVSLSTISYYLAELKHEYVFEINLEKSKQQDRLEQNVIDVFSKTKESVFYLEKAAVENKESLFLPLSELNKIKKEVIEDFSKIVLDAKQNYLIAIQNEVNDFTNVEKNTPTLSVKIDKLEYIDALKEFSNDIAETILDIKNYNSEKILAALKSYPNDIRLALPTIIRKKDLSLTKTINELINSGYLKWQISGIAGLELLAPYKDKIDITSDWQCYVNNTVAAEKLLDLGISSFTISPEAKDDDVKTLVNKYDYKAQFIIHQNVPLFISEHCIYANLHGKCLGENCTFKSITATSAFKGTKSVQFKKKEEILIVNDNCRSVVIPSNAIEHSKHIDKYLKMNVSNFRIDFLYRDYKKDDITSLFYNIPQFQVQTHV